MKKHSSLMFSHPIVLAFLLACSIPSVMYGQRKAIQLDVGGYESIVIGYEGTISTNGRSHLHGRISFGQHNRYLAIPIEAVVYFGVKHRLELAAGVVVLPSRPSNQIFSTLGGRIGYAYFSQNSPWILRAGWTPYHWVFDTENTFFRSRGFYFGVGFQF